MHALTHPARLERVGGDQNGAAGEAINDAAKTLLDALAAETEEGDA